MKDNESGTMFTYAATSSFHSIAAKLGIPLEQCNTIVGSGASHHYCPNKSKFKNFSPITDNVKLADGRKLPTLGVGDVEVYEIGKSVAHVICMYIRKITKLLRQL